MVAYHCTLTLWDQLAYDSDFLEQTLCYPWIQLRLDLLGSRVAALAVRQRLAAAAGEQR